MIDQLQNIWRKAHDADTYQMWSNVGKTIRDLKDRAEDAVGVEYFENDDTFITAREIRKHFFMLLDVSGYNSTHATYTDDDDKQKALEIIEQTPTGIDEKLCEALSSTFEQCREHDNPNHWDYVRWELSGAYSMLMALDMAYTEEVAEAYSTILDLIGARKIMAMAALHKNSRSRFDW